MGFSKALLLLSLPFLIAADAPLPKGTSNFYSPPLGQYHAPDHSYSAPRDAYKAPESTYNAPSTSYGTPSDKYGTPSEKYGTPDTKYGTPETGYPAAKLSSSYGAPAPKEEYGTPKEVYGAPAPKEEYGTPKEVYGAPAPKEEYGTPKEAYGAPAPKEEYGAPKEVYGPPKEEYGAPAAKPEGYATPAVASSSTATTSGDASVSLASFGSEDNLASLVQGAEGGYEGGADQGKASLVRFVILKEYIVKKSATSGYSGGYEKKMEIIDSAKLAPGKINVSYNAPVDATTAPVEYKAPETGYPSGYSEKKDGYSDSTPSVEYGPAAKPTETYGPPAETYGAPSGYAEAKKALSPSEINDALRLLITHFESQKSVEGYSGGYEEKKEGYPAGGYPASRH